MEGRELRTILHFRAIYDFTKFGFTGFACRDIKRLQGSNLKAGVDSA